MKVLLSIKPEYANKILDGEKRYEFRKSIPKANGVKTVVIYATKPVGMVVGEFDIDEVIFEAPGELWTLTSEHSGISRQFFYEYFRDKDMAYAIKVRKPRRYKEPLTLKSVLGSEVAPQSFCYIS